MTTCSVFGQCGGCNKLNIDYEKQLESKERNVFKMLKEYQINPHTYHGIISSPNVYGYRNKMEYSFGNEYKDGPLVLGLRGRRKKYDVFYTRDCKLVNEDFNIIVSETCEFFRRKNIPFRNYKNHTGYLRNLSIRRGYYTDEILVNLVTSFEESYDEEVHEWQELMLNLQLDGTIVSIIQSKTESKANVVKADEMKVLYGRTYFLEKTLDLIFKIGPFSFFQTNTKGAEVLYQTALSYADNADLVYDFYCGTGTISLLLSKKAKQVFGIEILEEAVRAAKDNAELNNIKNVQFYNDDVKEFIKKRESFETPDYIVVDPPRAGLHPNLIRFIKEKKFEKVIYISCNPKTLIPNIKELSEVYTLSDFHLVDMFPHTDHVECVTLMSRVEK